VANTNLFRWGRRESQSGLQLIYAVVYFGLLALVQKNRFSLDDLVRSRRHGHEFLD
jgi:hypothetical protein